MMNSSPPFDDKHGPNKDQDKDCASGKTPGHQGELSGGIDNRVLYCTNISTDVDYEELYMIFKQHGSVERIKLILAADKRTFLCYILFDSNMSASKACISMNSHSINNFVLTTKICSTNKFYNEAHDFVPADLGYEDQSQKVDRTPPTPKWYVATYKEGQENLLGASKHIQRKVGKIPFENLKRYGKNILIKANGDTQAELLNRFKGSPSGNIKTITPHRTFNTLKGVIYSRELTAFSDEEILDMCPPNVCQVRKLRGTNNAVLLTFSTSFIPDYITFDHLRMKVRRYRAQPTQCYRCFDYGHVVSKCPNIPKCNVCSQHHQQCDECELPFYCYHCTGNHSPNSRECPRKKFEQEVVEVAQTQYISIGSAKRQVMSANRDPTSTYASVVKELKKPYQSKKVNRSNSEKGKANTAPEAPAPSSSSSQNPTANELISSSVMEMDSDSLPDLESERTVESHKPLSVDRASKDDVNHSIAVETKSSFITLTKKTSESDDYVNPSSKKWARPVSPKSSSNIETPNKFANFSILDSVENEMETHPVQECPKPSPSSSRPAKTVSSNLSDQSETGEHNTNKKKNENPQMRKNDSTHKPRTSPNIKRNNKSNSNSQHHSPSNPKDHPAGASAGKSKH